jgi:hypothetical protein
MCAEEPTNYIPTPVAVTPGERSGMIDGTQTYYADKAYVSFNELGAFEYCPGRGVGSTQIGQWRTGDIVEFESSELFTLREPNYGTQYPFNFADLNEPVPRSAYMGISYCFYQQCATVGRFDYNPMLAVPAKLRSLDPLWANCALDFGGVFDPPHALASASLLTDAPKTDTPAQATDTGGTSPFAANTGTVAQPGSTPTDVPVPGQRPTIQLTPTNVDPTTIPVETGIAAQNTDPIVSAIMAGLGASSSHADQLQGAQQAPPADPFVTIGTELVQPIASQSGAVQLGSSVFKPGDSGIIENIPFTVGTGNVVIGTGNSAVTVVIPSDPGSPKVIIGSQTLSAGGPRITALGIVYSVGAAGLVISTIGNSAVPSTYAFTILPGATSDDIVLTIGGHVITATPILISPTTSAIVISGSTLTVGGAAATIDGTVVSLGPFGLVVGGTKTVPVSTTSGISTIDTKSATRTQTSRNTIVLLSASTGSGAASATSTKKGKGRMVYPRRLSGYFLLCAVVSFGLWLAKG